MEEFEKVSARQLIAFFRNFCIGMLVLAGVILLSRMLPYYFSPIVSLIGAAVLYTIIYNNKLNSGMSCMIIPYTIFYAIISFSFVVIILNVLYIWGVINIAREISFFSDPFIPGLLLDPICAITCIVIYLRRNRLALCADCKFDKGFSIERGRLGDILHRESKIQIINLIFIFIALSISVWVYYLNFYDDNAIFNGRDSYIFFWINVVAFIIDALYFALRYSNLYYELKQNDEIISEDELGDMTVKTYLRFYVVCGESVFLNTNVADPKEQFRQLIDTPFLTRRNANGIMAFEIKQIIARMTNINDGKLRFFYGRRNPDIPKTSILRYFYFIDGTPEDHPDMNVDGEWMNFNRIKNIYTKNPNLLSRIMLSDISRMTTIVLTQKIFDDRGYRKVKARSYQPTYTLQEIRDNDYDFQDDKWVRIAMFNSDTKGFTLHRLFRKRFDKKNNHSPIED